MLLAAASWDAKSGICVAKVSPTHQLTLALLIISIGVVVRMIKRIQQTTHLHVRFWICHPSTLISTWRLDNIVGKFLVISAQNTGKISEKDKVCEATYTRHLAYSILWFLRPSSLLGMVFRQVYQFCSAMGLYQGWFNVGVCINSYIWYKLFSPSHWCLEMEVQTLWVSLKQQQSCVIVLLIGK